MFACATTDIPDYYIPEAHEDYSDTHFGVRRGDILAVGEGYIFHIDANFDSLSCIGSIMQISETQKDGDIPMEPEFEADKIVIFLSKSDFADYKLLKHNEAIRGPLTTTIVLPVLAEAIHVLKEANGADDYDWRWMRALHRRIEDHGLSLELEPLFLAQSLLELPLKRALSSSRTLIEEAS